MRRREKKARRKGGMVSKSEKRAGLDDELIRLNGDLVTTRQAKHGTRNQEKY